jgi:hypothetical protein
MIELWNMSDGGAALDGNSLLREQREEKLPRRGDDDGNGDWSARVGGHSVHRGGGE